MLNLKITVEEHFDNKTQEFHSVDFNLELEHSLVSLSKWEQKFEKPYLTEERMTKDEVLWYIKAMVLTENVPDEVIDSLSEENLEEIHEYINAKMTATTFHELPGGSRPRPQIVTNELIYYWMFSFGIPIECETWHLNRLFTLIRIFNAKNSKPQKMSRNAQIEQRRALNEQRKKQYNTRG